MGSLALKEVFYKGKTNSNQVAYKRNKEETKNHKQKRTSHNASLLHHHLTDQQKLTATCMGGVEQETSVHETKGTRFFYTGKTNSNQVAYKRNKERPKERGGLQTREEILKHNDHHTTP